MFKDCKYLLFALLSFSAAGCSMIVHPQLSDVPLIDHKGDIRAAGSVQLLPLGATATLSAGLTDHIALQVHSNFDSYSHAAFGLYQSFDRCVLEGYLGLGFGQGSEMWDYGPVFIDGAFNCSFGQINYGWRLNKHHDIGLSVKGGRLRSWRYIDSPHWDETTETTSMELSHERDNYDYYEAQIFYRVGGEHVKFQTQFGILNRFSSPIDQGLYSMSLGISIAL